MFVLFMRENCSVIHHTWYCPQHKENDVRLVDLGLYCLVHCLFCLDCKIEGISLGCIAFSLWLYSSSVGELIYLIFFVTAGEKKISNCTILFFTFLFFFLFTMLRFFFSEIRNQEHLHKFCTNEVIFMSAFYNLSIRNRRFDLKGLVGELIIVS